MPHLTAQEKVTGSKRAFAAPPVRSLVPTGRIEGLLLTSPGTQPRSTISGPYGGNRPSNQHGGPGVQPDMPEEQQNAGASPNSTFSVGGFRTVVNGCTMVNRDDAGGVVGSLGGSKDETFVNNSSADNSDRAFAVIGATTSEDYAKGREAHKTKYPKKEK